MKTLYLSLEHADILRNALQWTMATLLRGQDLTLPAYDEDAGVFRRDDDDTPRKTAVQWAQEFALRGVCNQAWRQLKRPGGRFRLVDTAHVACLTQMLYHVLSRRAEWEQWMRERGEEPVFNRRGYQRLLDQLKVAELDL